MRVMFVGIRPRPLDIYWFLFHALRGDEVQARYREPIDHWPAEWTETVERFGELAAKTSTPTPKRGAKMSTLGGAESGR